MGATHVPVLVGLGKLDLSVEVRSFYPLYTQLFMFVCEAILTFNFNNISVISWRSVLSVEQTGRPGENHRSVASHLFISLYVKKSEMLPNLTEKEKKQ